LADPRDARCRGTAYSLAILPGTPRCLDPSRIALAFNSAVTRPRSHFGSAPRRLAAAGRIPPLWSN